MNRNDDDPNARDSSLSSGSQQELTLPWIIFSGSEDESSVEFMQLVQRLAFRHGRANDDQWIAQYASTCFSDDALIWYSKLDPKTRESWAALRLALLRQYPPPAKRPSTNSLSNVHPKAPTSQTELFEKIGIIKVLKKDSPILGLLAFDRISGTTTITDELKDSVWVGLPHGEESAPSQLHMMNAPSGEKLSCLGVASLPSTSGNPNITPKKLVGIEREHIMSSKRFRLTNVPLPSPKCRGTKPPASSLHSYAQLATWVLAPCEEGSAPSCSPGPNPKPEERRAALVWHYIKDTVELKITWAADDGSECELGGFVHRDTPNELHFHRLEDMESKKVKEFIQEDRVTFWLRPEPYK